MTNLILFEDEAANNLLPLTWTRPVWDLRCGALTLREAIEDAYSARTVALYPRPFLTDVVAERTRLPINEPPTEGMVLLLNGRILAERTLPRYLPMFGDPYRAVTPDGTLLGAWVSAEALQSGLAAVDDLPTRELDWPCLTWAWELLTHNAPRLQSQLTRWALGKYPVNLPGVYLIHADNIFIHPSAKIQPGVVMDASGGPIVVDANATVMAQAAIQGPSYVGPKSQVKIGAKIYHGVSIGPICKVGGEVEETIFQSYSNKQHDGFLGHAYLGEWCNLGAGTSNSDLKNNYRTVSLWANGELQDTGQMFIGLFMADHSKSAINTSFNTGTVVGVSCNIFGSGFPPKYIPSFSWGGADGLATYRLEDALDTAERVMGRRTITFTPAERALLSHVFEVERNRVNHI